MAVVFVNRYAWPDHSATSQLLTDLAQALVVRGHAVTVIASRQLYDAPAADLPASEEDAGVRYLRVATTRFGRKRLLGRALDYLSFYAMLPFTLARTLRQGDIVIAKTDPPLLGVLVSVVAWLRGARCVNWLQDVFPEVAVALGEPRLPRLLTASAAWLRDLGLRSAAMNVVIGERMATRLQARVPNTALKVIPNWALEREIRPLPREGNRVRRQSGFDARFIVAYSGNLGRAHDAETLLTAARRLRERADIGFLLIGDGHLMRQLQDQVERDALGNIRFLPYQPIERLAESLAAGDLHLVSLRPELEGLIVPSKFYGIAAAARPIAFVGDADGELAGWITLHECGVVVQPGHGGALAEAIVAMADSADRGAARGRNARRMLDLRFTRDGAHQQWHDLLSQLGATSAHNPTEKHRT
ncbi:MAG: glycosyltransferase family 4 protein [Xanthomonadales bacterium]|nr:glycosyltransferase family 4 protein [Xanthomonadales bacterium]